MNLSYICIVLYEYNIFMSGMEISSVDFPSISEVILSLWVSQIMTSLGPLSGLFFSKLLYLENFFLPLSQHCHKKSMSLSVSVSHHSLWGKQAAMSEAALCKWPCDKETRGLLPTANKKLRTANIHESVVAESLLSAEPQYDWLLSHLEVWQTPHERSWVKIT